METIISTPVTLTASAIKEFKRLMSQEGFNPLNKLRFGVKGGGCSGLSYILGFDEVKDGDEIFEVDGIPCVMNKAHEIYLYGMEIDWLEGLDNRGFTFNNPNASSSCGCGSSFGV